MEALQFSFSIVFMLETRLRKSIKILRRWEKLDEVRNSVHYGKFNSRTSLIYTKIRFFSYLFMKVNFILLVKAEKYVSVLNEHDESGEIFFYDLSQ